MSYPEKLYIGSIVAVTVCKNFAFAELRFYRVVEEEKKSADMYFKNVYRMERLATNQGRVLNLNKMKENQRKWSSFDDQEKKKQKLEYRLEQPLRVIDKQDIFITWVMNCWVATQWDRKYYVESVVSENDVIHFKH